MRLRSASALLLATVFAASAPAFAQGKGQGKGQGGGQGAERKAEKSTQRGKGLTRKVEAAKRMPDASLYAQPKGERAEVAQDRGRGNGRGQDKADKLTGREKADAKKLEHVSGGEVKRSTPFAPRGRGRFVRELDFDDVAPPMRVFVTSVRPGERLLGKAVALAFARGVPDNALVIVPTGPRYLVRNSAGVVVLDLAEERALNPGYWKVVTVDDRVKDKAPSFCRSGAGHPVWGRQWCLDKGFGLGSENDLRWSRVVDPGTIVFRDATSGPLSLDLLRTVVGDVVLDRLALHALTLGYVDPLAGVWMGEPTGPRTLFLTSGGRPIAELVDANRDNRVDNLLVALRPW